MRHDIRHASGSGKCLWRAAAWSLVIVKEEEGGVRWRAVEERANPASEKKKSLPSKI